MSKHMLQNSLIKLAIIIARQEKFFNYQKQYFLKQAIENEISILRQIDHPNILKLYEVFETDNSLYLITNYLQGDNLLQYLRTTHPIDQIRGKYIIEQLLQIQMYLSSKNIMHRDMKPENLIFANPQNDKIVAIDFGLAEKTENKNFIFPRCGTPGYAAPEIANNKNQLTNYGCECDIFSIGCIMHLILVGKPLFQGKTHLEVLNTNKACSFDFTQPIYEKVQLNAISLLTRLLEINPAKRITAANALLHDYFISTSINSMSSGSNDQEAGQKQAKLVQTNYLEQTNGEAPLSNEDQEDYQPNIEESYGNPEYQMPCFQSLYSAMPFEAINKQNEESKTDKSQTSASINQDSYYQQQLETHNNANLLKVFNPPQKLLTSPLIPSSIIQQQQTANPTDKLASQYLSNTKTKNSTQESPQNTNAKQSPVIATKQNNINQPNCILNSLTQKIPIITNHPFPSFQTPIKMLTSPLIKIQEEQELLQNKIIQKKQIQEIYKSNQK